MLDHKQQQKYVQKITKRDQNVQNPHVKLI